MQRPDTKILLAFADDGIKYWRSAYRFDVFGFLLPLIAVFAQFYWPPINVPTLLLSSLLVTINLALAVRSVRAFFKSLSRLGRFRRFKSRVIALALSANEAQWNANLEQADAAMTELLKK